MGHIRNISRMRLSDLCTLVKIPKPWDSRVPRLVNPPPTIPNIYKVVFHFGHLPFWVRSSSILGEVVFHFGWGRLPFWVRPSSILGEVRSKGFSANGKLEM